MAWYHEIASSIGALFGHRRQEQDLSEELRFHIEMETQRNVERGLEEAEARRRALRDFGGVERHKEGVRDERGTGLFYDLVNDTRFAIRSLQRRPGFAGVASLTLALGIGASTTLFGVVKRVLLTPLPYANPSELVVVWSAWRGFDQTWLSYDEWEGWKARVPAFADIGLYGHGAATIDGDIPERVRIANVHASILPILGVTPMLGRNFTPEEDSPGGARVVILGHALWQRRFNADPAIVGRDIQISGNAATVIGVMQPDFRMPLDFGADGPTEVLFALATDAAQQGAVPGPAFPNSGASHGFYSVARLASGATPAVANAQLRSIVAELETFGYMANVDFRAFVVAIEEQVTGRVRPVLMVVFAAVGLVMLIACANVAGLLLVRGESRRRELAVRVALGAGSRRLTRLLLAEAAVLAAMGGGLGVALAVIGVSAVRANAPGGFPRIAETTIDWPVLLFALAAAAVAALVAGLIPAFQSTQLAPAGELKDSARGATSSRDRLRWRQALVAAEVALAVVLVAGAGLMIRSVRNLLAIDTGFRADGVLTMRISTPSTWYGDSVRVVGFWNDVQERVAALPGVDHVGAVRVLPLASEIGDWGLTVEGYTPPQGLGTPGDWQVVTPGYFEAMGMTLRTGRFLDERDDLQGPLAMVVNHAFVEQYFGGNDPLGKTVTINSGPDSPPYVVVGVVDNVLHNSLTGRVKPEFYATLAQFARAPGSTRRSMSLVVHTMGNPSALTTPVRQVVREVDPRLPVSEVRAMRQVLDASIAGQRFAMELLGLFGVLALSLAAIGIYGIVSQVVASRAQELAIRAALGATPGSLVGLSLRTGLRQALTGLAIGVLTALIATRALRSMLHGVAPTDPVTFVAVVVVTGVVAVAASVLPARRAGRADPARALGSS
jgi:predicted permease